MTFKKILNYWNQFHKAATFQQFLKASMERVFSVTLSSLNKDTLFRKWQRVGCIKVQEEPEQKCCRWFLENMLVISTPTLQYPVWTDQTWRKNLDGQFTHRIEAWMLKTQACWLMPNPWVLKASCSRPCPGLITRTSGVPPGSSSRLSRVLLALPPVRFSEWRSERKGASWVSCLISLPGSYNTSIFTSLTWSTLITSPKSVCPLVPLDDLPQQHRPSQSVSLFSDCQ